MAIQHIHRVRRRFWLESLVAGVLLLLGSCASAPSHEARPFLVILYDFRAGSRFELASESHTDRVDYYSGTRADAVRKIQTDEIMSAFLAELDRLGLGSHARAGRAPDVAPGDVVRWGIEVEGESRQAHWLVGTGSPASEWQAFQKCRDTFLQLYNVTVSYQAVQNESGKQFFEDQKRASGNQKPGR